MKYRCVQCQPERHITAPESHLPGVRCVSAWANLALVQSSYRCPGQRQFGLYTASTEKRIFEPSSLPAVHRHTALKGVGIHTVDITETPHSPSLALARGGERFLGRNQPDLDGDTLIGKCQRSSHDPEAVHLHLNTYPSESGAAHRHPASGLNILPATWQTACRARLTGIFF